MSNKRNYTSESEKLFEDLFLKMATKVKTSEDTIFESIDISAMEKNEYFKFIDSPYYMQQLQESSTYEKNKIIMDFIVKETLSDLFTESYDAMAITNDNGELSFKQNYMCENTEDLFKVQYKGSNQNRLSNELECFTEGGLLPAGLGVGAAAAGIAGILSAWVAVPLAAFGAASYFGLGLLFSVRGAKNNDDKIREVFGNFGIALMNFESSSKGALGQMKKNIVNFDNIDTNAEVKALFNKLSKTSNKKEAIHGLDAMVLDCQARINLDKIDAVEGKFEYLKGKFNLKDRSILTTMVLDVFKNTETDKEVQSDLIAYRKCLSEKLCDMYKYLMIGNLAESKDAKKIIKIMGRGFTENPSHLLSFMPENSEEESDIKSRLMLLIQIRILLDSLAKDLTKGTFAIDKEAGTFLTQKLKQVDSEVESYLKSHQRQIDTLYETRKEFDEKDVKYNKKPEKDLKRKFWSK